MYIFRLIDELQRIADDCDGSEVEVVAAKWDDSFYDGNKIEGIRFVKDRDCEKNEQKTKVFIICE